MAAGTDDPDTVDVLIRAARDVVGIAPSVALELYRQARSQLDADDDRWLAIEVASLEPMARAGNIATAEAHARSLLDRFGLPEHRRRIHAGMAAVAATAGDLTTSTAHYEAAAGSAPSSPEATTDLEAVSRCLAAGQRLLLGGDPHAIAVELEATRASTGDPHVACAAHQGLALAAAAGCRYEEAAFHALESFRRFDPRTMPRDGFLIPDVWIASVDAFRDRFGDACAVYERVGYEAERRGEMGTLVHTSTAIGYISFLSGRWDDATREFGVVLSIAESTGANAHLVAAHAVLAGIAFGQDREREARVHLAAGHEALHAGLHLFGVDLLLWVTADAAGRSGDQEGAFAHLWNLWQMTATMRGLTQYRSFVPDLLRCAAATGRHDVAAEVVGEVEELASRASVVSVVAAARRCRALLTGDADGLGDAAEVLAGTPWRLDHARACDEAADALAASGSPARAQVLAASASSAYRRIGATTALARLARTHRTVVPEGVGGDPGAQDRWAALSRREAEVVGLVAEGRRNSDIAETLFISCRTAESHVASAMRKLGAANRTQLATIATARGRP